MDYRQARLTTPAMLPQIARHLDRNFVQAGLVVQRLRNEKTSSNAHGLFTVSFFEDVIKQNDAFTALLKTWLGTGRLPGKAEEAARLLSVLQDTTLLAMEAIATLQTNIPDAPGHVPDLHIPIEEAPYITAGLDLHIDLSTNVQDNFNQLAGMPLPMLTVKELDERIAAQREGLAYVTAIAQQVVRWRKRPLSPSQRLQVGDVAARLRRLRKLLTGILECCERLKRTGFTSGDPDSPSLNFVLRGLVQD